jgi:AbrB family looped-hinge helix DNA binding protein
MLLNYNLAHKREKSGMDATDVTVSKRGYIVLPAGLRKEMGIKPGTKILLTRDDDRIVLTPVTSFTERLQGLTAQSFGKTPEDIDQHIDRERKER